MRISIGDKGEEVKKAQTLLNKVGAMLISDGDFGKGTEYGVKYAQDVAGQSETGVIDDALYTWLESLPNPYPKLATDGVAFIAREETGGLVYYNATARHPHYPGLSSGITIGIGYDLRFNTEDNFRDMWEPCLPPSNITELLKDVGKQGSNERVRELKQLGVDIPFKHAWKVFVEGILPRFYLETQTIYPYIDNLPGLCSSALVSIVFNRGSGLSGSNRVEMKNIKNILDIVSSSSLPDDQRKATLAGVRTQILSMKRLWSPNSGLCKRREGEADMWKKGLENL